MMRMSTEPSCWNGFWPKLIGWVLTGLLIGACIGSIPLLFTAMMYPQETKEYFQEKAEQIFTRHTIRQEPLPVWSERSNKCGDHWDQDSIFLDMTKRPPDTLVNLQYEWEFCYNRFRIRKRHMIKYRGKVYDYRRIKRVYVSKPERTPWEPPL